MKGNCNEFFDLDGGAYYDNALWCMSSKENKLYKISADTGIVEYIQTIDKIENKPRQIYKIIEYSGKLILIPGYSKYIITYNILDEKIMYYEYKYSKEIEQFYKFGGFIKIENDLFLFPGSMKYMLKINLDNMYFDYILEPIKLFQQIYGIKDKVICGVRGTCNSKQIYMLCYARNAYIQMDIENNNCELVQLDGVQEEREGFKDTVFYNDSLIFLDYNGNLIDYNVSMKKSKLILSSKGRKFSCIERIDDTICLVPGDFGNLCFYNINSKCLKEIEYPIGHSFRENFNQVLFTFNDVNRMNTKIFITPRCNNMLLIVNLEGQEITGIKLSAGKALKKCHLKDVKSDINNNKVIFESNCGLQEYLELVDKNNNIFEEDQHIGKDIYNYLLKYL